MNTRSKDPKDHKEKHHKHRSNSDPNRMFHHQDHNVTVTVTVEQPKEDCMSGCFSALVGCFKKGAASG